MHQSSPKRKSAEENFAEAFRKASSKIADLQALRDNSYRLNGEEWCVAPMTRAGQVPARYIDNWIKLAEIEAGLLVGRWLERDL